MHLHRDSSLAGAPSRSRRRGMVISRLPVIATLLVAGMAFGEAAPGDYFRVHVVDEATGRGVPLARVETLDGVAQYTDSAGNVAFNEQGFMDRDVFFKVESPGYTKKKDHFGFEGQTAKTTPGSSVTISLQRDNIAERLYRITGAGIYRDSVLLGDKPPIREPILNAGVIGQDSTQACPYRGRLFWIWGDTSHMRYPLAGSFRATGARSDFPASGGLDPDVGVDLDYFTKGEFVKPMTEWPGNGVFWYSSLVSLPDWQGTERLLATVARIKPPLDTSARYLVQFNDDREVFEFLREDPCKPLIPVDAHPLRLREGGEEYLVFPSGTGFSRLPARYDAVVARCGLEAFTCLEERSGFSPQKARIARGPDGRVAYGWKPETQPVGQDELEQWLKTGQIREDECWFRLRDPETGKALRHHNGSISWNPWRNRWVMVFCELMGSSVLGETWYSEADSYVGPWVFARKVATHPEYSFYNPVQHPYLAKDGGRFIYFEGTYVTTFSGNKRPVPRYEYNQIMYKIDLADPRLGVPVPVYRIGGGRGYETIKRVVPERERGGVAFYALDRPSSGTLPVYMDVSASDCRLSCTARPGGGTIAFHAFPASGDAPRATQPLIEYVNGQTGSHTYTLGAEGVPAGYRRTGVPVCRVWADPAFRVRLPWRSLNAGSP